MEAGQDSIHEAGKGGRCVAQTKGDLVEFEQLSTARSKCGLRFVLFGDRHLPVSTFKVQSREPFSPMESIQEVINPGQKVSILDGSCIELTEVNTETQTTVLFPHYHHWGGPWAVRGTDDITRQHLLDLCHLLPENCGVLPPVGLAERRPMGLNPMLQQWGIPRSSSPWLKTSWNSLNNSLSCCCWSRERHSGSGGWQGFCVGCEGERRRLVLLRGGPPRGSLYFALCEAEWAQAGDCARHTRAPDHLRAQECRSQRPGEHHQGKKGRPQWAMGCDNGQGGLSREEYLLFEAAEHC